MEKLLFYYNLLINFADDIIIRNSEMNTVCIYCNAKQFKEETPGLCYGDNLIFKN